MTRTKERIPQPLKDLVIEGVKAYSVRTSALRIFPDFLVIGAQRSGTTSLYRALVRHPDVARTVMGKGVHFFDVDHARGAEWYRGHFPTAARRRIAALGGRNLVTGEASPYYLFHPLAPERVAGLLPDVRLIAMLRDPVARAFSHYQHFVRRGIEPLPTFEAALDAEPGRLAGEEARIRSDPTYRAWNHQHFSYVARGLYAEQLERWFARFPRERLLVLRSEDVFAEPEVAFERVEAFLGLAHRPPPRFDRLNAESYAGMSEDTRARLVLRFEQPNDRLRELLGPGFRWDG